MVAVAKLKAKPPWEDKFRQPSLDELLEQYNKQQSTLFENAREHLLAMDSVKELLDWHGLPWRWSLAYSVNAPKLASVAFLVPNPTVPTVGLPMSVTFVQSLPMRKLKKPIREGLTAAKLIGESYWSSWELTSKTQLEEVSDLLKRKYEFLKTSK